MKHLSDELITKELENLSQKFKPSRAQKERAHRSIFQENGYRKKVRTQTWIPTVVTFILLISIISGAFFLINDNGSLITGESSGKGDAVIDITDSWRGMELKQSVHNTYTNYIISFNAASLRIQDDAFTGYNPNLTKEKIEEQKNKRSKYLTLKTGEFTNYSVQQKQDTYIITVSGEEGFTYTLEQSGPRKLVGEDGIEFSANLYLDLADVITDEVTPERLEPAPQSEHTFLIEWGSDSMDRGNHDFDTFEHGPLVVSTDFTDVKRGQAVYYHTPPSVIAKNAAIPEMYIGRVVGLPGETVEITSGQVYIDGKRLETFYGKATMHGSGEEEYFKKTPRSAIGNEKSTREYFNMNMAAVTVKEDTVFILVDQWWRGTDSLEFGPLPIDEIEGVIIGLAG